MCALFGWLDYKHIVPYKVLKKLTQALANAAEERGTDAAGISYIKDGKVTIFKRPKPAHKIHFNAPDGTTAIMGHTRLTTQGNQKFNQNNHPFLGRADKSFSFAHNGVLYNDVELRKEKHLPDTNIETDSYIAVQLIEQQGRLDFDSLKNIFSRSEFEGKENFRYSSFMRYFDDWEDDYYTQHEQLLLDMCSCYGVDEDDVIMLLDYGYSADEIEDMLCDYSLVTDTIRAVKGEEDYDDFLCEI